MTISTLGKSTVRMFRKILHANDGSEHAFHALALALAIAKQNNSELHMVSVERKLEPPPGASMAFSNGRVRWRKKAM
jgi:nucleotide-binding universal stress UspA family protein